MYENFFGLAFPPFQIMPDSRFYFGSSGHSRALAHLTYGLAQGNGFIVLTGEVGAGKTTLIDHLLTQLDPRGFVAARIVTSQLSPTGLLRMILCAFKVDANGSDKAGMLRRFDAFCCEKRAAGVRILLIVDEVQNLPFGTLEELRMLSNLGTGSGAPLQTCLIGQPQFLQVIQSPRMEQLRQRICTSYHLGVLKEDEVGEYIQHRLRIASWSGDPSFDDDVFPAVHAYTGGVPRRINLLCSRLLLRSYLNEVHRISRADVCEVADEWLSEPGTPSADDAQPARPAGKQAPRITERLNVIERKLVRQENALSQVLTELQQYAHARQ
jgi:putative secretion ATPase (PEP-CTERM system associated)